MKLNIGDIIYQVDDNIRGRHVIDRVTDRYAFAKKTKFSREYSDGNWICIQPRESFPQFHYVLETPELKEQYEKLVVIYKIGKIDLSTIHIESLKRVLAILNEKL
jgi:hypothetical protein